MQAVILAAGRGSRLQDVSTCKPLTPLLGTTLLERNVRMAHAAGARRIIVVTGYRHDDIALWHRKLPPALADAVTLVHNPHWETTENGYSLAQAATHVSDRFLLLMADHVYSDELIQALAGCDTGEGAALAIDRRLAREGIDPDDATKVLLNNGHIQAIGKQLEHPHAYDTGAFVCSVATLPLLQHMQPHGNTGLSAWMQRLADKKHVLACDVGHAYWQDVDTPTDLAHARQGLLTHMQSKSSDGPVARYLNRPCSRWITSRIIDTGITPNAISWMVLTLTVLAASLIIFVPTILTLLLSGVLVQTASILDGCDGEIARLRSQSSAYGGWLDAQLDRYGDAALLAAMTWLAMQGTGFSAYWVGMAALAGSFMVSYSAHKSDQVLRERVRVGRDLRMLIIAVGIALNQPVIALWILAISMNVTVAIRLYRMRHAM